MAVVEDPEVQAAGALAQELAQALLSLVERALEAVEVVRDQRELLLEAVACAAGDRESLLPFIESLADSLLAGCVFFSAEFFYESLG